MKALTIGCDAEQLANLLGVKASRVRLIGSTFTYCLVEIMDTNERGDTMKSYEPRYQRFKLVTEVNDADATTTYISTENAIADALVQHKIWKKEWTEARHAQLVRELWGKAEGTKS